MAAQGIFAAAVQDICQVLELLGVKYVTDPRNARPLTVLVEPPSFVAFNTNIAEVTMTLRILAAPPGNQDAADYLVTTADIISESELAVIDGRPATFIGGGQEIPSYDLTVRVASRRY